MRITGNWAVAANMRVGVLGGGRHDMGNCREGGIRDGPWRKAFINPNI